MIASYFQHQAELASMESNMRCPDDCSAPGCWMDEVIVEVNIFDVFRLSLSLNASVANVFMQYCCLGFKSHQQGPRYQRLLIKLRKPCGFLQAARCMVHGSKPLSCVLFPEYHQIDELIPELTRNPTFRNFPCLKGDIYISEHRSDVLKRLKHMSDREKALSNHTLFETPALILDAESLPGPLRKNIRADRSLTRTNHDKQLSEVLRPTGLFDSVTDKILRLDSRTGMEGLFEKLNDNACVQPLLEELISPEYAYRLKGNRLKRIKRRLRPPDVIFR